MFSYPEIMNRIKSVLAPPPDLSIWEWAERDMVLSVENSAQPGRYKIDKTPFLKEPFEAVKSARTTEVALQFAAQCAKSTFLNAIVGYVISEEPSPGLFVMPSLDLAESYSKDRIAPMIRDSQRLSGLIETKARDSSNTILHKQFANGAQWTFVGANSPSSLKSRPCRFVLVDEVSGLPESSGNEGDPLFLAKKRASTFHNKKIVMTSTPTDVATCKMHQIMTDKLTRRHELQVKCPHCREYIKLEFTQLRWDEGQPETAVYDCQECKKVIRQSHKNKMLKEYRWYCVNPEASTYRMGFKMSAFYSPWVSFEEIARESELARRDQARMRAFVNTYLGEAYEAETEGVEYTNLFMRREKYPKGVDVPAGGLVLTCGVDTQDDRLEAEVVAWGSNDKESWSVGYYVLWGDPAEERTWEQLTDLLNKNFSFEWGFSQKISAVCIDSGGHHTSAVYEYVKKKRKQHRIFAVKGMAGEGRALVSAPVRRRSGRDRRPVDLYTVGVDSAKALVYQRLRIERGEPGYCHFPLLPNYDQQHFKNLVSEKCQVVYRNGYPVRRWFLPDHLRNEQLDNRVYALAALTILNPIFSSLERRLMKMRDELIDGYEAGFDGVEKHLEEERTKRRSRIKQSSRGRRTNYATGWMHG